MNELDLILKLVLALLFGGAIGYFREKDRKAAGLRTHILVCLGSALFSIVSIYAAIGMALAFGYYPAAIIVTLLSVFVLTFLGKIEKKLFGSTGEG